MRMRVYGPDAEGREASTPVWWVVAWLAGCCGIATVLALASPPLRVPPLPVPSLPVPSLPHVSAAMPLPDPVGLAQTLVGFVPWFWLFGAVGAVSAVVAAYAAVGQRRDARTAAAATPGPPWMIGPFMPSQP